MGLDYGVWLIILTVIVLCTGWISYKRATEENCDAFSFAVKGVNSDNVKSAIVDEVLRFRASLSNAKNISWDFGDHSPVEKGSTVIHSFKHEGTYTITATVNGKCETIQTIYVRKPVIIQDNAQVLVTPETVITGNDAPEAGEAVTYTSNTSANSYEWSILNRQDYKNEKNKLAVFKFKTPGSYTLQLKLDNDRKKVYTRVIQVLPSSKLKEDEYLPTTRYIPPPSYTPPKPAERKPENIPENKPAETKPAESKPAENETKEAPVVKRKKIFYIPNDAFMSYLTEVVNNEKDAAFFSQYLNNEGETLVQVKGEDKPIKFSELIQRIKGNKRITIKDVRIDRDANNDVLKINVDYKKKKFLPF